MRTTRVPLLSLAILIARLPAAAQQPPAADVEAMLRQAREEIRNFEKAGGKKDDSSHPVEKWVQALWRVHDESPRTPEAATAASEAVHLLVHADRFAEVYSRADRIATDDPAWQSLAQVLLEAASLQKDFTRFFEKLQPVASGAPDATVRAAVQLNLGRGWLTQKNEEKAKTAFTAAIRTAGNSVPGRQAERGLYQLLHLGPGQPAPVFSATALDGSRFSLADHRGKPVVIVFWGST